MKKPTNLIAKKRTTMGHNLWGAWDPKRNDWTTVPNIGWYKTKKAATAAIEVFLHPPLRPFTVHVPYTMIHETTVLAHDGKEAIRRAEAETTFASINPSNDTFSGFGGSYIMP